MRTIATAVLAFFACGVVSAREVQKVGTTSMTTLKIASSVRAAAMGDAFVATADDINSVFWNPAGLIHVQKSSAMFTQINMPADIQFNTASAVKNLGDWGVVGLHLLSMNTGDMPVRTIEHPNGTGENFIAYDLVFGGSWAQRLTDRFIFGLNLRLVNSGIEEESYTGMLVDIGTLYETSLRSLKIGMSVQNFGPDIKYSGTYSDYLDQARRARESLSDVEYSAAPPPTIYRLGVSSNIFEMTGFTRPADFDGTMSLEMSHPNDNRERINLGAELWYRDMFAVRGGYKIKSGNSYGYDEEAAAAGFGLKIPVPGNLLVMFDYAYVGFGKIADASSGFASSPHRFALSVNF